MITVTANHERAFLGPPQALLPVPSWTYGITNGLQRTLTDSLVQFTTYSNHNNAYRRAQENICHMHIGRLTKQLVVHNMIYIHIYVYIYMYIYIYIYMVVYVLRYRCGMNDQSFFAYVYACVQEKRCIYICVYIYIYRQLCIYICCDGASEAPRTQTNT